MGLDWAGIRSSIMGLVHLLVMGLGPLSATDDRHYKYRRHGNEELIQKDHGDEPALPPPSPSSISHPLSL